VLVWRPMASPLERVTPDEAGAELMLG
jgi:hypothetical protein